MQIIQRPPPFEDRALLRKLQECAAACAIYTSRRASPATVASAQGRELKKMQPRTAPICNKEGWRLLHFKGRSFIVSAMALVQCGCGSRPLTRPSMETRHRGVCEHPFSDWARRKGERNRELTVRAREASTCAWSAACEAVSWSIVLFWSCSI